MRDEAPISLSIKNHGRIRCRPSKSQVSSRRRLCICMDDAHLCSPLTLLFGDDLVLMQGRIAELLGIHDGDVVEFELVDVGETIRLPVKINDIIKSDVLIHDWNALGLTSRVRYGHKGAEIVLKPSGKTLLIPGQEMWAGLKAIQYKGNIILHFKGASRGNPIGPAGYGFRITIGVDENELIRSLVEPYSQGTELIRGYGHGGGMDRNTNEMEYCGLLEGLIWALRLDPKLITICGDSTLILQQVFEQVQVEDSELITLHAKVLALMDRKSSETTITYTRVPQEENRMAELLANMGIDSRENVTLCNWANVNNFMYVDVSAL